MENGGANLEGNDRFGPKADEAQQIKPARA
jgi:hypothetical protein